VPGPELDPPGFVRKIPIGADELVAYTTPQESLFVLAHFGIPRFDLSSWRLEVGGLVDRPRAYSFEELTKLPARTVESFHQCAGFPRRPDIPTRRIGNVAWTGVDVREILHAAGARPNAGFLIAHGADEGEYDGFPRARYVKDMPLSRLAAGGVLLAYAMNGEPLTREHGSPLRLVIPGYYGTNSVKWLVRLELAEHRPAGLFTTELYNDPAEATDERGAPRMRPLWEAGPESIIVGPKNRSVLPAGSAEVWGWAWSDKGVAAVAVSIDGGSTWLPTTLEPRRQWSWQRFSGRCALPAQASIKVMARATDVEGAIQPLKRARNAVHAVNVRTAGA
jgi:sulfane dehydrogenase subunit SoxC